MKPKIEFISMADGLESIEECRPKPAKNFIPQWFKDIPPGLPNTVKHCPSFPDYFSTGYVLPMWTDIRIGFKKETQEWSWNAPSDFSTVEAHTPNQFINYVKPSFLGIDAELVFKFNCPWRIITPKGWSVLQLPLFYNFNKEFSVLPGVIDTDIHHEINQQVLYHGSKEEVEIKRGTPLALYIPFKREDVYLDADVRFANQEDMKKINKQLLNFNTLFRPGIYRKIQRERDKNV
jgi:hypothetical protein